MARKSSAGRGQRRRRDPVDWVVNDASYGTAYNLQNGEQVFIPLAVPEFLFTGTDPTGVQPYPRYTWPEQDEGQVVRAVVGSIQATPSVWAAGSFFRWAWRIVKKPAEYANGFLAIVDPTYNLELPQFANERFLQERKQCGTFALGGQTEITSARWKGVCKLDKDEALWLILQNITGVTQRIDFVVWFRTLMRANE